MSLLVLSAARFEAEQSLEVLKKKYAVEYYEIGIGPIPAAKSDVHLQEICKGRDVLYLGSCGSFYPYEDLHLITVDKVYWMPACLRMGLSSVPEGLYSPYEFQISNSLEKKSVLTSATISLVDMIDEKQKFNLPPAQHLVENMELYACAPSLLKAKTLNIILGVTNQVGPQGHDQWLANFKKIAKMTAEFLERKDL